MPYSDSVLALLAGLWFVAAMLLAWRSRSPRRAFWGSAIASIPGVGYSMMGHGLLPMGGAVHVLSLGVYGLLMFWIASKAKRRACTKGDCGG